jgi:hypothetical protein
VQEQAESPNLFKQKRNLIIESTIRSKRQHKYREAVPQPMQVNLKLQHHANKRNHACHSSSMSSQPIAPNGKNHAEFRVPTHCTLGVKTLYTLVQKPLLLLVWCSGIRDIVRLRGINLSLFLVTIFHHV